MEPNMDDFESSKEKGKFFSKDLLVVVLISATWSILFITGFSRFFIGFGINPVATVAEMLGQLAVPIIPAFFVAKLITKKFNSSFLYKWIAIDIGILILMTIGTIRGGG
jgi:hypothetical protein